MASYEANITRSVVAILIGTVIGGALNAVAVIWPPSASRWPAFIDATTLCGATIGLGLLVFASPAWWFLHRAGWRGPATAGILGATLGFVVAVALLALLPGQAEYLHGDTYDLFVRDGVITSEGWAHFLMWSGQQALICAVVGLAIWRVAYRRAS